MTRSIIRDDWLVPIAVVVVALLGLVALLGWSTYVYSAHSFATRDRERLQALARITSERDALASGQQLLVLEQQRLQRELVAANAQLAESSAANRLARPGAESRRKGYRHRRACRSAPQNRSETITGTLVVLLS